MEIFFLYIKKEVQLKFFNNFTQRDSVLFYNIKSKDL